MEDSNIFVRVGKDNVLLEDLTIEEFDNWVDSLDKEATKRCLFIVCCALERTKANCKKAIDKLYCCGEMLDADFQKEMLEILGVEK